MLTNTSAVSDDNTNKRNIKSKSVGTLIVFIEKKKIDFNVGDIKSILTSQSNLQKEIKETLENKGVDDFSEKEHKELIKLLSKKANIKILGSENGGKSYDASMLRHNMLQFLSDEAHFLGMTSFKQDDWDITEEVYGPQQDSFFECGVMTVMAIGFFSDNIPLDFMIDNSLALSCSNEIFLRSKIAADIKRGYLHY